MSSPPLPIDRRNPGGEPGVLVAARLMGELLDVPGIIVALTDDEAFTLEVSADVAAGVRRRVEVLLTEPRFARWRLRPV